MDTRTFNCTPTQLQTLATAIAAHGLVIDPTKLSGECKTDKWDALWNYNGSSALVLNVEKHPFGELGIFWSKIQSFLNT